MKKRFVIEGTWSGYYSHQRKVAHRDVWSYEPTVRFIRYTDGTTLDITVRPAKKYERVIERHGYDSLILQAERFKKSYVSVDEIIELKKQGVGI